MAPYAQSKLSVEFDLPFTVIMSLIKRVKYPILLLVFAVFFSACKEEKDTPIVEFDPQNKKVFVLNEGNFQSANGSVSLYNPILNTVYHDVFKANNAGRPLGDVVQSMSKIGDNYFIVVNNSSKIEVVSSNDFTSVGKIDGLNSPRYLLPISDTKAYVSDLYANEIYVINPQTLSIKNKLPTKGWTEEMVLVNSRAFVCQVDSAAVWVFDVEADSLLAKISTNLQPLSITVDVNGKVWVGCSGGINKAYPAIHRIDPLGLKIEKSFEVSDVSKSIASVQVNENGDKLLYLMNEVFEMDIEAMALPTLPKIPSNGRLLYSLGLDPDNGDIYLSDAIDYLQQGSVYRYNKEGEELSSFKVGLIPGSFYFD